MSVHVTTHAVDRYIERVAPVSPAAARRAIEAASPAIARAAAFGAHVVRLGNGAKLILRRTARIRVVTVLWPNAVHQPDQLKLTRQPVSCGLCGMRTDHPIASACIRPECPLGAARRGGGK